MKIKKLLIVAAPAVLAVFAVTSLAELPGKTKQAPVTPVEEVDTPEPEVILPEEGEKPRIILPPSPETWLRLPMAPEGVADGEQVVLLREHVDDGMIKLEETGLLGVYEPGEMNGEPGVEMGTEEAYTSADKLMQESNVVAGASLFEEARRRGMNCSGSSCFKKLAKRIAEEASSGR